MNGSTQIKIKQYDWAIRNKIPMNQGYHYYADEITGNIFRTLDKLTEDEFRNADGGELTDTKNRPAKMKAIHSSSALAVNVFQYWRLEDKVVTDIASACGLCNKSNRRMMKLEFERKFTIHAKSDHHPNIDVVISPIEVRSGKIYAIESKMTEPYGSGHSAISDEYLETNTLWHNLTTLRTFSKDISRFRYLDVAQLVKHILGLMNEFNDKSKFVLLYLYYDVAGADGAEHFNELKEFESIAKSEGIDFKHLTYQELISKLRRDYYDGNEVYCDYIVDRYL